MVKLLTKIDGTAIRLDGSQGSHDIDWYLEDGRVIKVEVKFTEETPKTVYKWMDQNKADLLVVRRKNERWLAIMEIPVSVKLLLEEESN